MRNEVYIYICVCVLYLNLTQLTLCTEPEVANSNMSMSLSKGKAYDAVSMQEFFFVHLSLFHVDLINAVISCYHTAISLFGIPDIINSKLIVCSF